MSSIKRLFTLCILSLYVISAKSQVVFSPTDYSNLKIWLKSTDGLSISSNSVSNWVDQSGFATNFQSPGPTTRPIFSNTSILNGYPYLQFGGQAQLLSNQNYSFSDASIFIVATQKSLDNAYGRILDHDFQSGFWLGRDAGNNAVGGGFIDPNSPYGNFAPIANDAPFIYSMTKHSDTTFSSLNHIPHSPPYRITSSSATQSNSISIGATLVGNFFGHKDIFEVIIYNRHLDLTEQQQVERYLNDKYAPPLQLTDTIKTCLFPVHIKAKQNYFSSYTWQDNSVKDSLVVNSPGKYFLTVSDVFGRTSSDTVYVIQNTNATSVNLRPDTAACAGAVITLNAGEPYFSYLWSTSSTSHNISVTSSGLYKVTMTDCNGNVSKDSVQIDIHPIPVFNLGNDTIICSNTLFKLKPNLLQLQNCGFTWHDNSTDSTMLVNTPGKYTLVAKDNIGCQYKDSILISIDNQLNNISLGNDTNICAGNQIKFINAPSSGVSYSWNTGAVSAAITVTITGQYSAIITNTNYCVVKDTINVNIQGQAPIANFTTSIGCYSTAVSFTDLSTPPLGNTLVSYNWNFGDVTSATNTSTLSNPSHTYTNTGTYTVSLKVISSADCEQTILKTIQVFPKPTANFISGLSCQNDNTSFSSLSTSTPGYSITALNWNFGDPGPTNTSTLTSPTHLFSNQANYTIKLVVTNNVGCKDSLINIISVKAQVKADFNYTSPCTNTATLFQDNSIYPLPISSNTYTWNFVNSTNSGLSVSKTYTNSGVYSVSLNVKNVNGCSSTISKVITIFSPPTASFSIPAFCSKDTITPTNLSVAQSGVITSYNWKLNAVNFSTIQNPTLSVLNAGNFPVKLTVINSFGCKDSITKTITVNPLPNVDFTTNPAAYYYINSPVNFIPSITNASSYNWNLSSIGTSTIQNPSATYNTEGTYTVSLNLKDLQGCRNSVTKTLLVSKRFLDVAILNVNSSKDSDGFMTVQTDIANYGSIPVSSLNLSYKVSDGGNAQETWNGTLNPNSFFSYTFVSKTATQIGSSNNITCVDVKKANGINDQNQTNNELCNVLNTNNITVSNPIPNPTSVDITLPIILNKEIDFSVSIYNSNGQIQFEEKTEQGMIGLNLITLPTTNYARGYYVIKIIIDDKIFIKKFIKISNE